jgi:hypothetical protein
MGGIDAENVAEQPDLDRTTGDGHHLDGWGKPQEHHGRR